MTEGNNWGLFDEKLKSGSLATFVVSTANFSWRGKLRICATDHREIAASAPLRANRHIYRSDRCAPFRSGAHDGVWRVTWSNDAEPICANAVPASRRTLAVVALLVVGMVGLGSQPAAHNRISQVTWTTDVEPVMKAQCLGCHTTAGFGPMSLETYQQARTLARAIREEVLDRRMPPSPAAQGLGSPARSIAAYRRQRPKSV